MLALPKVRIQYILQAIKVKLDVSLKNAQRTNEKLARRMISGNYVSDLLNSTICLLGRTRRYSMPIGCIAAEIVVTKGPKRL